MTGCRIPTHYRAAHFFEFAPSRFRFTSSVPSKKQGEECTFSGVTEKGRPRLGLMQTVAQDRVYLSSVSRGRTGRFAAVSK